MFSTFTHAQRGCEIELINFNLAQWHCLSTNALRIIHFTSFSKSACKFFDCQAAMLNPHSLYCCCHIGWVLLAKACIRWSAPQRIHVDEVPSVPETLAIFPF